MCENIAKYSETKMKKSNSQSIIDRQTDRQSDRQTVRQTNRQTVRQTNRQTDRWMDRQTVSQKRLQLKDG